MKNVTQQARLDRSRGVERSTGVDRSKGLNHSRMLGDGQLKIVGNTPASTNGEDLVLRERRAVINETIWRFHDTLNHPFRGQVVGADIVIGEGDVWGLDASAAPGETLHITKAKSTVAVSISGSIWLPVTCILHATSQETVISGAYPISWERFVPSSLGAYTTVGPTPNATWDAATAPYILYYKILDFDITGGVITITKQYVKNNIHVIEGFINET